MQNYVCSNACLLAISSNCQYLVNTKNNSHENCVLINQAKLSLIKTTRKMSLVKTAFLVESANKPNACGLACFKIAYFVKHANLKYVNMKT